MSTTINTAANFLFELGCEELPPKSLLIFAESLQNSLQTSLAALGLSYEKLETFATPRRLAVLISELITQQPAQNVERKGPAASAAFDAAGNPTKALEGFLRANNATVAELHTEETPKGAWLSLRKTVAGATTASLLPTLISDAIKALPIPKPMRWGAAEVEFIRPVHWLVMLFGNSVIDCEILGLKADQYSYGHRFHHPTAVAITAPEHYLTLLRKAYVIADFNERKAMIRADATQLCEPIKEQPVIDADLLNEVTAINEWPVPLRANFAQEFLEVPAEALISAMQHHQKCFPIMDAHKNLLPAFIFVANISSKNPEVVIKGNERVMHARLSDASFFYKTDRKIPLETQLEKLSHVLFQEKLGSIIDKTQRIEKLCSWFAANNSSVNSHNLYRAAKLCKSDLVSDMVGEFPELQGIMGRYYAEYQDEPAEICAAIEEHYQPRYAEDQCPQSLTGALLSIADRIDTLVGIFSIGMLPSGNKDPFALRRAALGIIKISLQHKLHFDLQACIAEALKSFHCSNAATVQAEVLAFIWERFRGIQVEQGMHTDVVSAVLATNPVDIFDAEQRIHAVAKFCGLSEASALASANKRVRNILEKTPSAELNGALRSELFSEAAERDLHAALTAKLQLTGQLAQQAKYFEALQLLAELRSPVDKFFDSVLVMAEDPQVRLNRMKLLRDLRAAFMQIADISQLQNIIE